MKESMLEAYIKNDFRLELVNDLARKMYEDAQLAVHNYHHAVWVAEKAIMIGENEQKADMSILIPSALLHDAGAAIGDYRYHAVNGGKMIRRELPGLGFRDENVEKIAVAVEEHSGLNHGSYESKYLFDADTLNKSGRHGIMQSRLCAEEFGMSVQETAERYIVRFPELIKKGYYTQAAKEIDKNMGINGLSGLEMTLEYWKKVSELLKEGNLGEMQILSMAESPLGV